MVSNREFAMAWGDPHVRGIMNTVCRQFRKLSPHDRLSCQLAALWDALEDFDAARGVMFTTFLYAVTRRKCLRTIRERKTERLGDHLAYRGTLMNGDPIERRSLKLWDRAAEDRRRAVHEALGRLAEQSRRLIRLHFWDRMTVREIAAKLGCSKSAAARRLDAAIESLRPLLRDWADSYTPV